MSNRRRFLKQTGLLAALPILGTTMSSCKDKAKNTVVEEAMGGGFTCDQFGIQIYSIRDFMSKDPKGTLKGLADYGYHHIESYQGDQGVFWNMEPKEFKNYIDDLGINMFSTHCDPQYALKPEKLDEFKKLVDDSAAVGMKYLVNPYMAFLKTVDEFKAATEGMNKCGEVAKSAGLNYMYHNHSYSFKPIDGILPQDIMMGGTDEGIVDFEMDIYWVVDAGEDPLAWLEKYPGRWKLSHVKDRIADPRRSEIRTEEGEGTNVSCVLGTGHIDFGSILQACKAQGMAEYIVEQERYDGMTSMEAIAADAKYMKQFVG